MDQNPYQSPGDHEGEQPVKESNKILKVVFWHVVIFFAAIIFLLFAFNDERWGMRIACGLAVAAAVWSFSELGRIGYGSDDEVEEQPED